MSITTIRPPKASRQMPQPKCGRRHHMLSDKSLDVVRLTCDLPADHLPPTEHAALVRWSS